MHRAMGWPAPTEAELRHIAHGAELLSDILVADLGYGWPDDSPEARFANGLSVEVINAWNSYRRKRDAYGQSNFNPVGRKPVRRDKVQPSLDKPFTMTKPLCIVARSPKKAYPLDKLEDWKLVPRDVLSPCDVGISAECHKSFALITLSLKRGEFVTVHQVCNACYRWPFAYSSEAIELFRDILVEHHVEPTNGDRRAQLVLAADAGVL
ncbi:hypothetical protein A5753_21365 [Mycobacterium sp. 852002-51971_SCH5477799-a]|nr:hypothetical protein A5753_21365 [Mycobacterium sp. 852002-51971_SCH5477799-a]